MWSPDCRFQFRRRSIVFDLAIAVERPLLARTQPDDGRCGAIRSRYWSQRYIYGRFKGPLMIRKSAARRTRSRPKPTRWL